MGIRCGRDIDHHISELLVQVKNFRRSSQCSRAKFPVTTGIPQALSGFHHHRSIRRLLLGVGN